ncbi:AraC family transcriptional regulator [bacterium]|nr:MAG: AraC family transcriptional regulator [bacterium]
MKSLLFEDVDYIHVDPRLDMGAVWECYWWNSFAENLEVHQEFPLQLRRERYDRTSEISHRHNDFLALYIVRGGRGSRLVNGYAHSMARGDVFLMSPDTMHCFREPVDLTVDAIYFQKRLWCEREWEILSQMPDLASHFSPGSEAFAARGNSDHFGHLSPEPHARVEATLANMRRSMKSGELPQHLAARARLFALLVQLAEWRMDNTFTARPARGAGIAEVLSFCDNNFHRPISNEQLAGLMHFSEAHFREVFTREVGMSPRAYLRHIRLQHAQKLLKDRHLSIADIARLSGFGDSTQLGRAFKKAFGVSPLNFRKK